MQGLEGVVSDSERGRYKIGPLSRITGLKPELLRAWQRRFKLFEPERTEGRQRVFTPDDLRIALYVRDLLAEGQSIGGVARRGRAELLAEATAEHPNVPGDNVTHVAPESTPRSPAPTDWKSLVDDVVEGAVAIDRERVAQALRRGTVAPAGDFLMRLVEPAMRRIGELWQRGECSVAGEHLASTMVRDRLSELVARSAPPPGAAAPEVIVAGVPDDRHENGALAVAARMASLGWRVTWLGPTLPIADLDRACRALRPHAVYLSATQPAHFQAARPALLALARRWSGAFELVVGGQGAPETDEEFTESGGRLAPRWTPPSYPEGWTEAG